MTKKLKTNKTQEEAERRRRRDISSDDLKQESNAVLKEKWPHKSG